MQPHEIPHSTLVEDEYKLINNFISAFHNLFWYIHVKNTYVYWLVVYIEIVVLYIYIFLLQLNYHSSLLLYQLSHPRIIAYKLNKICVICYKPGLWRLKKKLNSNSIISRSFTSPAKLSFMDIVIIYFQFILEVNKEGKLTRLLLRSRRIN